MSLFNRYRLEKVKDEFIVVLYIDSNHTEFSDELGHLYNDQRENLISLVSNYINQKLPNVNVNLVRIVHGCSVIAVIPSSSLW
jgi:hypothetical protein